MSDAFPEKRYHLYGGTADAARLTPAYDEETLSRRWFLRLKDDCRKCWGFERQAFLHVDALRWPCTCWLWSTDYSWLFCATVFIGLQDQRRQRVGGKWVESWPGYTFDSEHRYRDPNFISLKRKIAMALASATPYAFNTNELLTLGLAAYAAVVSTFVLGWDAYKWLASGAKIDMSTTTGMRIFGGPLEDRNTYISITARNVGDQPTTITNLGGMYFDSWWRAYVVRRRPSETFIVNQPSEAQRIPYRFEVGGQWIGLAEQTDDIAQKAAGGYLFFILYTAKGGRGQRVRVKLREKKSEE